MVRVDAFATKNGVPVQDLTADDFEVFEDGAPQKVENFEHIVIEPTPGVTRVDPSSVSQAIQLAADPHRRVFVIYLDTASVDVGGSHDVRKPLVDFMNRVMSDDDRSFLLRGATMVNPVTLVGAGSTCRTSVRGRRA